MIDDVSTLLRHLFVNEVPDLKLPTSAGVITEQVRFEPPDENFVGLRNHIVVNTPGGPKPAPILNVYLVDLRENRKLRSNERIRDYVNGTPIDEPAAARVDCHYLITAWMPGEPAVNFEPALSEQALLYEVMVALFQNAPLNSSRLSPPLGGLPVLIQDVDLPTSVVPVEGFPKLGEFWSTMEPGARWRPAVYLVVTVPVAYRGEIRGPLVTTKSSSFAIDSESETFLQIGGVVLDAAGSPVDGAWVRLESPAGLALGVTASTENGRFSFDGLRAGSYTVRVRAAGLGQTTAPLTVPSPAGGYEVQF